jgi:preprotein translocase subunit SecA
MNLKIVQEPSKQENKNIDPKNLTRKISRNEPCPCGSGKKYKRCCGSL